METRKVFAVPHAPAPNPEAPVRASRRGARTHVCGANPHLLKSLCGRLVDPIMLHFLRGASLELGTELGASHGVEAVTEEEA